MSICRRGVSDDKVKLALKGAFPAIIYRNTSGSVKWLCLTGCGVCEEKAKLLA